MTTHLFEENTVNFTTPNGEISINDGGSFLRVVKNGNEIVNLLIGEKKIEPWFAFTPHLGETYIVFFMPFNILIGVISEQGVRFYTAKLKEGETPLPVLGEMNKTATAEEVLVANNVDLSGPIYNGGWEYLSKNYSRFDAKVFPTAVGFRAGVFIDESLVTLIVTRHVSGEISAVVSDPYEHVKEGIIGIFFQAEGFFIATASNFTHNRREIDHPDDLYDYEIAPEKRLFLVQMNLAIHKMNSDQGWDLFDTFYGVNGHMLMLEREDGGVIEIPDSNCCDMVETDGDDRITSVMINYETSTYSLTVVF